MGGRYGYEALLVVSDDAGLVRRVRREADELFDLLPNRVFSLLPPERAAARRLMRTGKKRSRAAVAAHPARRRELDELLLLADADAFVGDFDSPTARVALALSAAQKGGDCLVPFASLGAEWRADFGRPPPGQVHTPQKHRAFRARDPLSSRQ